MNATRSWLRDSWFIALAAALLFASSALCRAAENVNDERAGITREREAAEATFVERDAGCRRRFVVSSCLEDARRERREALDALRERQVAADEVRRRARAEARRADLAARGADDASRERDRVSKAALAASSPSGESAASAPRTGRPLEARREGKPEVSRTPSKARDRPGASSAPSAAKRTASETATQDREARLGKEAAFEARKKEAARHRDDVLDATTRRMLQRSPAPSLPTPSAPARKGASAP